MRNLLLRKSFFDPLKSHRCPMFFPKTVFFFAIMTDTQYNNHDNHPGCFRCSPLCWQHEISHGDKTNTKKQTLSASAIGTFYFAGWCICSVWNLSLSSKGKTKLHLPHQHVQRHCCCNTTFINNMTAAANNTHMILYLYTEQACNHVPLSDGSKLDPLYQQHSAALQEALQRP